MRYTEKDIKELEKELNALTGYNRFRLKQEKII